MKTKIIVEELSKSIEGRAESKGFVFTQMKKTEYGYIYKVESGTTPWYEIFERRSLPKCIDFKERVYSDTIRKENYPKKNAFGKTAFTCSGYGRAEELLAKIEDRVLGQIRRKAAKEAKNG